MELSAAGQLALPHAEQIFMLGNELEALLHNPGRQGELALRVGLTDAVPKSIAYRLLYVCFVMKRNQRNCLPSWHSIIWIW